MFQLFIPSEIKQHFLQYNTVEDIPQVTFDRIKNGFAQQKCENPLVSIVVVAHNEEKSIISSLSSLSSLQSKYSFEVIVANNNSTDRTQELLDKCGVKSVSQPIQGVGYARQAGLQLAKGKYHLSANADSIYPPHYIDEMIAPLETGEAICTYGRAAFLPDGSKSRLALSVYEFFKDIVMGFRAINHPEQVAGGASMAFFTRMGKQIGWSTDIVSGEEGQMVSAMKRFGNVKMVKSGKSRIWTIDKTNAEDGSYLRLLGKRVKKEFSKLHFYITQTKQNV